MSHVENSHQVLCDGVLPILTNYEDHYVKMAIARFNNKYAKLLNSLPNHEDFNDKLMNRIWEFNDMQSIKNECTSLEEQIQSDIDAIKERIKISRFPMESFNAWQKKVHEVMERIRNAIIEDLHRYFWVENCIYKRKDGEESSGLGKTLASYELKQYFQDGFNQSVYFDGIPSGVSGHFICPPEVRLGIHPFNHPNRDYSGITGLTLNVKNVNNTGAKGVKNFIWLKECTNLKTIVFQFDSGKEHCLDLSAFATTEIVGICRIMSTSYFKMKSGEFAAKPNTAFIYTTKPSSTVPV